MSLFLFALIMAVVAGTASTGTAASASILATNFVNQVGPNKVWDATNATDSKWAAGIAMAERSRTPKSAVATLTRISIPATVRAQLRGSFIYDRPMSYATSCFPCPSLSMMKTSATS